MSGLAGLYSRAGGAVERGQLEAMTAALVHRGPDGGGVWIGERIGLGHRMLRTTPESLGEVLPDAVTSPGLAITADARLDNRDELRMALGLDGRARAITDSSLLLAAYERWGDRCPEFLVGDFAFAIWDERRRRLFCARDPFGVRPLFFHSSGDTFAFASELKALLQLPGVSREPDERKIAGYLDGERETDEWSTFYRGVRRLPPAHSLVVADESTVSRRYWTLDPERELRLASDREYEEAFRAAFEEAVRVRLRSSSRVGALLSGGFDSSAVVAVARAADRAGGGQPLPVFSLVFDDPLGDERRFVDAVVAGGGLDAHVVDGEAATPLHDLVWLLRQADEPFWMITASLQRVLYETARARGVRVLLDGLGGDQVVSYGLSTLAELTRRGRWLSAAREIAALSRAGWSAPGVAWTFAVKPNVPEVLRAARRTVRPRRSLLRADVAPRVHRMSSGRGRPAPRTARAAHVLGILEGLPAEVNDRLAAASSVELRYPFFDRRLVELCVSLPARQKLAGGSTRAVARRALAGVLPDEVRRRAWKATPVTSLIRGLLGPDRPLLERVVEHPSPILRRYVDEREVRRAYRRALELAAEPAAPPQDVWPHVAAVWKTMLLSTWLESVAGLKEPSTS